MNNAALNLRFGKDGTNSLLKAGQVINTGNEYVFKPPVLKIGKDHEPEVSTFVFRHIDAKQVFYPFLVDTQDVVDSSGFYLSILFYLVVHCVHPDDAIKV